MSGFHFDSLATDGTMPLWRLQSGHSSVGHAGGRMGVEGGGEERKGAEASGGK